MKYNFPTITTTIHGGNPEGRQAVPVPLVAHVVLLLFILGTPVFVNK